MSLQLSEHHEARVRELCEEHGCDLVRRGEAWRILGPRVDVITTDLSIIQARDMLPVKPSSMVGKGRL